MSRHTNPPPATIAYLVHHGILGQKWGKRNGPLYPLGASDHSVSEKKAGWRKTLDRGGESGEEVLIGPFPVCFSSRELNFSLFVRVKLKREEERQDE